MKKIFALLLFVCAAIALHGQSIYVPGGINYGGSLTIKETQGTGAPSPTCSGFIRYWQTDASTSPMWECLNGSMVNIGTGSGGSGSSFAVTTTATGLQTLIGAFQAPNIFVGSSDTNVFRCGATCLGLGSAVGTVNGSFQALNITGNDNGVLNPTLFTGSDIGAKMNAALATMSGGGTLRIPRGTYSFATTVTFPGKQYHIDCDAGTTLNYTGSGDAFVFQSAGQATMGIDGNGGCTLNGTSKTGNGIDIKPTNQTYVTGMRILNFNNAIYIPGGNTVEIFNNTFQSNNFAAHAITSGTFSANAVHFHDNEVIQNGWGYYSENGHVSATPELGVVIRDNVFEEDVTGDVYLAWDAHTIVTGNYFESSGVGVSVGAGLDNVYDIDINGNYFTAGSNYRSEIEIGYGFDFFLSNNYEEGSSVSSHCKVNIVPGPNGGTSNVNAENAFVQNAFGYAPGATPTANELCFQSSPVSVLSGTRRFSSGVSVAGQLSAASLVVTGSAQLGSPVTIGPAEIAGNSGTAPLTGGACSPEGFLIVTTSSPAHLDLCSGGFWRLIY
jgi:hypothetical protein